MALHDTIRARRKELGLSQEYLAEQLGISRQAVAKWEAGQSRPTAANLAALAAVLELPVSALVDPVGAQPLSSAHPGEKEKNIKWRLRRSGAYILLNTGWDGYSSGLYGIAPLYWLAILAAGLVLLFMTSVEREKQLKLQNMPKVQIALGALMLFSIFFLPGWLPVQQTGLRYLLSDLLTALCLILLNLKYWQVGSARAGGHNGW